MRQSRTSGSEGGRDEQSPGLPDPTPEVAALPPSTYRVGSAKGRDGDVKDWGMIHKIKALHDDGQGLSIRAIGQELGISRNTVRKYLRQDEATIEAAQSNREREKKLDAHRDYIVYLLRTFPRLSSVKVARKLREKVGELAVSERTLRRYVQQVKSTVASRQRRNYEPVLNIVPGWPLTGRRPSRPATGCCSATPWTWSRNWNSPR